jgi:adenine-specific DNA-methyltransferase
LTKFSNPDKDLRGPWRSADVTGLATKEQRPNLHYDLIDPETNSIYPPPNKGWRFDIRTMTKKIFEGRIIFPKNLEGRPRQKMFLSEMTSSTKTLSSIITDYNTGDGTKEINSLLGNGIFDFPKPSKFIQFLIDQVSKSSDIILDSFAGSGTTAHAVLNLNKQDGGNRRFILIEMEDYAETITAERVKRVINGYSDKEGTGGSFDFYTLGEPMFDAEGLLNEKVGVEKIRQYVYYTETKESPDRDSADFSEEKKDHISFMGKHNDTAYYFHYDPEQVTTLNHDFLAALKTRAEQYVIYADNCVLTRDFMTRNHLIFKKIPRDITRF